jgi:hypothetical protein
MPLQRRICGRWKELRTETKYIRLLTAFISLTGGRKIEFHKIEIILFTRWKLLQKFSQDQKGPRDPWELG